MTRHTLDVRRQLCPIPVIKTQNKVKTLAVGDVLEVVATDPGVFQDIPAWCRVHGHAVLECKEAAGEFVVVVEKK